MFRPDWGKSENGENEASDALRQGLRLLPVPDTSTDFDARIHAVLRQPTPWWREFWNQARPVLATAACSLLITLAILEGLSAAPASAVAPGSQNPIVAHRDYKRMAALENDDLSSASFSGFVSLHRPFRVK